MDEFTPEESQNWKEFRDYVRKMIAEYHLAGIAVYRSSRCCKAWKE